MQGRQHHMTRVQRVNEIRRKSIFLLHDVGHLKGVDTKMFIQFGRLRKALDFIKSIVWLNHWETKGRHPLDILRSNCGN